MIQFSGGEGFPVLSQSAWVSHQNQNRSIFFLKTTKVNPHLWKWIHKINHSVFLICHGRTLTPSAHSILCRSVSKLPWSLHIRCMHNRFNLNQGNVLYWKAGGMNKTFLSVHSNIFIVPSDDGSGVSGNKHCPPVEAEWTDTQSA